MLERKKERGKGRKGERERRKYAEEDKEKRKIKQKRKIKTHQFPQSHMLPNSVEGAITAASLVLSVVGPADLPPAKERTDTIRSTTPKPIAFQTERLGELSPGNMGTSPRLPTRGVCSFNFIAN